MDEYTTKACSGCHKILPLHQFARAATCRDGRRGACRGCANRASALRYESVGRERLFLKRYGITINQYDKMLAEQGGACALCGASTPGGRWSRFSVDHCHETGRVRGLLCYGCNSSLGALGDTPEALLRAYRYVANS